MANTSDLILGETARSLDERYRISVPAEMTALLTPTSPDCILAKERPGCLSLWSHAAWRGKLETGVELLRGKIQSGRLAGRTGEVQRLGRLLSTRHKEVQIVGRGRLLIPESFREFLGAAPGEEVIVIGAAVCVEIWHPTAWIEYLQASVAGFQELFENLTS